MPLVVVRARLGNLLFRHLHVVIGLQNIVGNGRFGFGFVHVFLLRGLYGESAAKEPGELRAVQANVQRRDTRSGADRMNLPPPVFPVNPTRLGTGRLTLNMIVLFVEDEYRSPEVRNF